MPSNKRFLGGLIGADPLRVITSSRDWTPSDLTDTPYVWVDGDQGLTNQGDGGSITVTTGWTDTSTQNGLGTVGNTTNSGRFTWTSSSSMNTTFALVKGDSAWTTRGYATMFSGVSYEHLGGSGTSVIASGFSTVETWRHTRENGTQIGYVSGDWGTKSTDWELYVFQSSTGDPWALDQFGNDRGSGGRHFTGEMAEILALEEELSLADIEKVEGYLMHKWGLAANLPSDHTYKTSAPSVQISTAFQDPGNVDRVTANAGVLSIDTAGPEDATLTEYTLADYTTYSETQLTASNNGASDEFGQSCDMSGDGTITVFGAPFEDGATNTTSNSGAVYVYENGTEVAILRASDSAASDQFGFDVAISNDGSTIAVGANNRSSGGTYHTDGAVYVYEKPTNGWATTSSEDARLTNTAASVSEELGRSVAISDNGDTIVVGRSGAQGGTAPNVVHVYERPTNGWANTSSNVILSASNGEYADDFGSGLAISGDGSVIAIGAPDEDTTQNNSGTVYVYEKPTNGWATATEDHFLGAPTRTFGAGFGYSCSLNEDGTILAVGEYNYGNGGRVLVLEYNGSSWSHSAALTAGTSGNAGGNVDISRDGTTVAATDNTYNSTEGAIYIWLKPSSGWANSSYHRLITAANGNSNDSLGGSTGGSFQWNHCLTLSNDGGKVLSAAPEDDDTNTDSGSGFLFAATTTVPSSVSTTTKGSQWFWGGMRGRNAITAGQSAISGDTYWNDVEILIDGTSLTQEQSSDTLSITNSGTTLDPTVYKFNQGQALYGDAYDYVAVNDTNLSPGTGDFTFEFWAKGRTAHSNNGLWSMHNHTNSAPSSSQLVSYLQAYQNSFTVGLPKGGTSSVAMATLGVGYTSWNHFALVRSSGTLQLFVNGKLGFSVTDTTNITAPWQNFGNGYPGLSSGQYGFDGYMEQIRVTIGVARYYESSGTVGTQTFTAPTAEFPQNATQAASSDSLADTGVISLSEHYQVNWTEATALLSATFDALLVGGGGGGGAMDYNAYRDMGAGGGAEVATQTSQTFSGSYTITIGEAGAGQAYGTVGSGNPTGGDGGRTTFNGTTVKGGGGGFGHASGSPWSWSKTYSPAVQGGGGSSSSLGNKANGGYTHSGNYHTNSGNATILPGNHGGGASGAVVNLGAAPTAPGPGVSSSITGTSVEYGIGGWGGYGAGYPDHTDFGCGGRSPGTASSSGLDGLPGAVILRVYGYVPTQSEIEGMITSGSSTVSVSVASDGSDGVVTFTPSTTTTAASFTFTPS